MNDDNLEFNRRAVRPVQCFVEGWQLIKDDYWLFFGIAFLGMLIGRAVPLDILLGPMWCGIDICLLRRMRGERVRFAQMFDGFNYFMPSMIGTLFVSIPTLILTVLIIIAYVVLLVGVVVPMAPRGGGPPDAGFFASLFGVIAGYVVALTIVPFALSTPLVFMYPLIVERGLSGPQAFMTSVRAVFGNLYGVIGLQLLHLLLVYAGMMLCFFGVWLVLPITFAAFAVAYRQVFPREELREVVPVDEALDAPLESQPTSTGIQAEAPRDRSPETGITPE
jgi:hypothetical protein